MRKPAGLELADGRTAERIGGDVHFATRPVGASGRAWARLEAETGRAWATWRSSTKIPSRILTSGVEAPGSSESPHAAAAFARAFLDRHLDLLAPGASPADFSLVSNDWSAGIRTVGFQQLHRGIPVVGGQVSFRFKADRLVVIASEALPHVSLPVRARTVDESRARLEARRWLQAREQGRLRTDAADGQTLVLPVLTADGLRYHEVVRAVVDLEGPASRWAVYVDAETGRLVAREQLLAFGTAQVRYDVPVRGPLGTRTNARVPRVWLHDGGETLETDDQGNVSFAGTSALLEATAVGPLARVSSQNGPDAEAFFDVFDGGTLSWSEPADEFVDAQLSAFVHTMLAKAYVRKIAPGLGWLDQQIPVNVNIDDQCNAFSDGNSINFYAASNNCENTARVADVVYHEFGHSVHNQSLIVGAGFFDVALSEGISDYLAATMTGDPGVGRGFFYDDTPIRHIDPPGYEYRWPDDRGEVHAEGLIIGGALWDLRKRLIDDLGTTEGIAHTDLIWYESTRRAVDIPSMYVEALVVDDDDGNLANGTPNVCAINDAYGPHGLFSAGENAERVTIEQQPNGTHDVALELAIPSFPGCPVDADPTLEWRLRSAPEVTDLVPMTPTNAGYTATIPAQRAGEVVQYRVRVNYGVGTERSLPDNPVDPWYEIFVGDVVALYCTGFDDDSAQLWEFDGPGNDWSIGPPTAAGDANDPLDDYSGDGMVLSNLDAYSPLANTRASSPVVNTVGYDHVRLQYRRWLTVEDGFFDTAIIYADGVPVWENYATDLPDDDPKAGAIAHFHHTDREWRFHDVDLSDFVDDGAVAVQFEIRSDAGLQLGGWTIDDLCIVAVVDDGLCGNGELEAGELCDDGNDLDGDGCSSRCEPEDSEPGETGGSGSGSGGSDGDDGDDTDTDGGVGSVDGLADRGCACATTGPAGMPVSTIGWGVLLIALRRRKRSAARASSRRAAFELAERRGLS